MNGDVDCDGDVDIGDAQKTARSLIGLPVHQEEGCPEIGQPPSASPALKYGVPAALGGLAGFVLLAVRPRRRPG